MYAPRQRQRLTEEQRKRPYSNFLALAEMEGPIMAPPVYSITGDGLKKEEEEPKKEESKDTKSADAEQAAVKNNRDNGESEGPSSESESSSASAPVQRKEAGRHEPPPQFKLKASSPRQFKFADGPTQFKTGAGTGGGGSSSGVSTEVMGKMESAMGADFSGVQIHQNSQKATEAGALAYAQGNDIHFAPGQFSPETPGGQQLLGHELAHVVQQRQGRVQATTEVNGMAANTDKSLEAEADAMGAKAAQMKVASPAAAPVSAGTTVNSAAVQRKEDPSAEKESAEADGEGKDKEGEEPTPQVQNPNDLLALGGFKSHEEDKDKKGEQEGEKESLPSDKSNGEGEGGGSGSSESAANEGESSEAEAKSSESEESNESEGSESEQEQQAGDQPQDQAAGESEGAENEEQSKEGVNAAESKDKDQAKDKVKDSKDKAADDKSTADSGGGDAGSGAANGGGADSAAGGGGGGGGGSAEGASISGGGAGSGGGGGGQVPAAKVGNFGEGQEPELTLVNKAAVKDFDPNNIIKDNGDGTYLVISSSVASPEAPQEAPAQLAPDPTKDKPLKKKIPQSQSKEAMAANRQRVQQSTSQFDATASAKISAFEQTKSNISTQVLAGAEAAKGAILSAAETEKARVQAGVAAEKQTLSTGAERIKGEVRTKLQAALAAVKAAADAARTSVQTEYDTQDKAFVTLEGTQKTAFTDAFKKAKQDLIDIGEKYAKLAIKEGEDQAARYAGEPVPEMGTGAKILKGGSYEQDRHDAKVKGAKDAGEGYAKSFRDNAKQKSEELNGGEAEMHKYVTDSVKASRDAIQQRKQTALDEIKTQEEGAGIRLNQQSESTILNIDGAAQQAQISLDEQMNHSLSMIETTAVAKAAAVDEAAQNFIKNLEFQFQGSVDALYAQKNAAIEFISNQNNPSVSMAEKHFAAALAGLDESITTTGQMITEGITGSVAGLNDTATESATELNTAASTAIDSAAQTVNGTITGLEGQRDGFGTTAQSIQDGTTGAIKQAEDSAKKEMQDQYKAVTDDFNKAKTSLDAKMGENSRGFDNNIKAEYDKCPKGIEDKANEAKEAVRPRWVRWLLVAIDILVVLIITAIVLAAMASGVGILGLLLIGAVAGAAGGALKYCARVGLTSEKWDTGKFFKETLDGAFDGVNIAVGLIPGVGPAVLVGMGALGGAFKYGTDVIFTPGKKFSWGELAGKTLLGGVQGAFGAALGHYGNSWGAAIAGKFGGVTTKVFGAPIIEKAFSWTFQSVGNWVMGGGSAVVDNWITTGVWDTSKFSEAMTLEALVTAAGTTVVGDWGAARSKGIETSMGPKKIGLTGWSEPTTNTNSNAKGSTTTTETTNSNNESTNTKTSTNEAPVNNETTNTKTSTNEAPVNNESTNTKTSTNEAPVNNETTNTKTSTNEAPVNNETTNNKGSNHENTTPENTGPKPKDTVNAPESNQPVKLTGKEQAAAKGYPEAPPGYEWVAGRDGEPYIRRTRGGTDERVQVRFDPESGTFKPTTEAPTGYHWELVNGEFQPVANSNAADTLPPIVYDPVTGGFKEAATGKPFNGDLTQLPVRGQDFEGFQKSISEKDRIALQADPQAMQQAYEMFATKDWAGLEALFNAKGIKWPPNRGFISVTDGVLPVGSKFDRFGGWTDEHGAFQDKGTFVAPYGASFEGRALPDSTKTSPFNGYEVLKPIPMKEGPAIPWFGKEGGGMQYELSMSINDLIAGGYIKKIDAPDLNAISGPKPTTETNTSGNKETTTPKVEETNGSGNKENTTPKVEETNVSGNKETTVPKDAVEPISKLELEKYIGTEEMPSIRDIPHDEILRAKSPEEFAGNIARWLKGRNPVPESTQFVYLKDVAEVRAYEKKLYESLLAQGAPEHLAKKYSSLIDGEGNMPNAVRAGDKILLLPDTVQRMTSTNLMDRAKAMKTICHEWWHAMRSGKRNPGFEEGGADLFSEMMMVKKTGITTELTNSYQSLRDGVEMLRQVMGDQWFYESRNQADTNAFLRKTLGEKFNATAVEQLINHATNLDSAVSMRDWLELVKNVVNSPK